MAESWASVGADEEEEDVGLVEEGYSGLGLDFGFLAILCVCFGEVIVLVY